MNLELWLRFRVRRALSGISVPEKPVFDSDSTTAWFTSELACAQTYVEYGSGGSTVVAAALGLNFATCDSDKAFLLSVKRKIERMGYANPERQTFRYTNLGLVTYWGAPLVSTPQTPRGIRRFQSYSDLPCDPTQISGYTLVLVDGRFRVACALKAASALLAIGVDFTIVVDDFVGNDSYRCLSEHLHLQDKVGRMAVLRGPFLTDGKIVADCIREKELDPT
jgi:hypothetical protein